MCKCGCNTCGVEKPTLMLNENLAPRAILSEGLKYHLDTKKPLTEHLYRAGSTNYFNLWAEARSLYSRQILEITNKDDLQILTETDLGHYGILEQTSTVSKRRAGAELKQKLKGVRSDGFGKYDATVYGLDSDGKRVELKSLNDLNKFDKFELAENKKVPLDFPIELNEQMDIYDEIANMEFGMDYDQLGSNEKEWVHNEIDNMSISEAEKLTYNDFVQMVRDDMMAGASPDEKPSEEQVKKKAKTYYNDYLQGTSVDDLFEAKKKKEWVRDEMDNMSMNEVKDKYKVIDTKTGDIIDSDLPKNIAQKLAKKKKEWTSYPDREESVIAKIAQTLDEAKKDIYSRFLDNPQNPKGRAKDIISKFLKRYGEGATQMSVDWFAKQNNLKPEEKYILKYITKNDIQISSRSGGPDFSALREDKKNNKKLNKPMRDSSGGKAYKVYVKDPKTKKIKTVRFGSGGLKAKINDPKARQAFAKRHKCSTKNDKTKASYWSCRLPRYAKLLGLKSSFTGFW